MYTINVGISININLFQITFKKRSEEQRILLGNDVNICKIINA